MYFIFFAVLTEMDSQDKNEDYVAAKSLESTDNAEFASETGMPIQNGSLKIEHIDIKCEYHTDDYHEEQGTYLDKISSGKYIFLRYYLSLEALANKCSDNKYN